MTTKPYPFQAEAVRKVVDQFNNRAIIGMEQGLGKTLVSLLCCLAKPDSWPAVVVCPATIKLNWQKEAALHCGIRADVLETTRPPSDDELPTKSKLWVINYEILHVWLPWLKRQGIRTVITDECQRVSNPGARCTKAWRKLCEGVPYVLPLSGTPLNSRPVELYVVCNVLRPDVPYFNNPYKWGHRFCGAKWTRWGWDYRGASNLSELHALLKDTCCVRYLKKDVLQHMPPLTRTVLPVPTVGKGEYDEAVDDFLGWLRKTSPNKVRSAAKAERVVQIGYLKRLAAKIKHKAVTQWVQDFLDGTDEKLILFGIHRDVVMPVYDHFKKHSVLVHGGVKGNDRQRAIDQFNQDRRKRIFVGNIRAAGVGWNGQVASTVAFMELDWTPAAHLQGEKRADRLGQKNAVNSVWLVADGTIEVDLCEILQRKAKVLSNVLDGVEDGDDLDVFDQLEQALLRKRDKR